MLDALNCPVCPDIVQEVVRTPLDRVRDLVADTIRETGADVKVPEVFGDSREGQVTAIRWLVWKALRDEDAKRWSLPRLGRALGGFDHTTVIHGLRQSPERIAQKLDVPRKASADAWARRKEGQRGTDYAAGEKRRSELRRAAEMWAEALDAMEGKGSARCKERKPRIDLSRLDARALKERENNIRHKRRIYAKRKSERAWRDYGEALVYLDSRS